MKKKKLPQKTIEVLIKLGKVLKKIDERMRTEGYEIVDGKIRNVETGELWVRDIE